MCKYIRLQGYVGGTLISVNASNTCIWKTAFISFAVPAGTSIR
uniref:IncI1 plasmid conjugative transfer pilus-tip adhesin protein PilV n=1 Tax=Salmonella enteritidis TaxID=149539 RepID=A0A0S0ZQ70_SALEN|nr:IncI1 plasmid conjugative transfer pilus-tip adhesin protein PilV [Salmonella enterica subsp. enterica serovar Enteritidis]